MLYQKEIQVRYETDVFIAGGGPAGVAAALAARALGATVYLAEGHSCFGGMGTAGLVPAFCGIDDGVRPLAGWIGEAVMNELIKRHGNGPWSKRCIQAEALKRLYDEMMVESGADFTFETRLVDVAATAGKVDAVILNSASGLFAAKANVYIDCTGNGDLAAAAGAAFAKGDENGVMMPPSLCSLWSNVDWPAFTASGARVFDLLVKAIEDGAFTHPDLHHTGMNPVGKHFAVANMGHVYNVDATDDCSVTRALVAARALLPEFEAFYRKYVPGFADVELAGSGSLLGVRESRRIEGEYTLTIDDFRNQAVFDDEIGRFAYSVDIHPLDASQREFDRFRREHQGDFCYRRGESYGIPFRIMVPKKLANVLVAGRCVSADQRMGSSIRVMPGCFITGQAAGAAAALAKADGDIRGVDVRELQRILKEKGMYLPNFR